MARNGGDEVKDGGLVSVVRHIMLKLQVAQA